MGKNRDVYDARFNLVDADSKVDLSSRVSSAIDEHLELVAKLRLIEAQGRCAAEGDSRTTQWGKSSFGWEMAGAPQTVNPLLQNFLGVLPASVAV